MSVLLSTAYLDEAERCDEVILLHEGRVLDQGPPAHDQRAHARAHLRRHRSPGVRQRDLQAALTGQPGRRRRAGPGRPRAPGDGRQTVDPAHLARLPGLQDARIEAVPPRFEDGFIALLHAPQRGSEFTRAHARVASRATAQQARTMRRSSRCRACRRRFGDFYAVDGVSFEVRRGEIFGLLGANGAGKSTTFRMLCGLLPASAGTLRVAGVDLRHAASTARARIGYMSQKFSLYGNLSVRAEPGVLRQRLRTGGRGARERRSALGADGVRARRFAEQLSADLLARLQAAPGAGLRADARARHPVPRRADLGRRSAGAARVLAAASTRWRAPGVTVLVTTHFMEEAEYCDRLAIMAAGRILAIGEPAAIKAGARSRRAPRADHGGRVHPPGRSADQTWREEAA